MRRCAVNLWEALLHPDKEELENPERRAISDAANILQVGEFQLLQLAYRDWYDEDLPEAMIDRLFRSYMIDGVVPPWARHYARKIVRKEQSGRLDYQQRRYHRYDCDYNQGGRHTPKFANPIDHARQCHANQSRSYSAAIPPS